METIAVALGILLIVVCVATALLDFTKNARAIEMMAELGIKENRLIVLGLIKVMAAVGIVLGFSTDWIAVVTGVCLSAYFLIATATHVQVKHPFKKLAPPLVLTVISALFTLTTLTK